MSSIIPAQISGLSSASWTYITGIDATGSVDASSTIQAAITALSATGGGRLYIPPGTFKISTALTLSLQVSIWGAGVDSTILKAGGANKIATQLSPSGVIDGFNSVFNYMTLDGNGVGTVGVHLKETGNQNFTEVHFKNFVTQGTLLEGAPIVTFTKCNWTSNAVGVRGQNTGSFQSNHIIFQACRFTSNTTWAADVTNAGNWAFYGSDFEVNGTVGDDNSGVIRCNAMCPNEEGRALLISGCWAERNSGFAFAHLKGPAQSNTMYSFRDSLDRFGTSLKYGIYVDTSASTTSFVLTEGLMLGDHSINDVKLVDARGNWQRGPTVTKGTNNTAAGTVTTWG